MEFQRATVRYCPAGARQRIEAAIARKPDFADAFFQHADYYAHFLIDEAPGHGPALVSATGVGIDAANRQLAADFEAAYRHERDPDQRRVIQVVRTTVSPDWRSLQDQIARAFAGRNACRHGLWIDQTASVFGHGEAALARDLQRLRWIHSADTPRDDAYGAAGPQTPGRQDRPVGRRCSATVGRPIARRRKSMP
ncbi:MAG: hypothetical protein IPF84_08065 [Proteobacteria bacterium]|nr:hypothetical protein [Pseudomonadota bacterium]